MLAAPRKPANGGSARPDLGAEPGSPGRQIPGSESAAAPPSGTSRPGLQLRWGGGGASGHVGVIPPRPPLPEPAGSGLLASARGLSVFLLRNAAQQPWLQASSVRPSRSMAGSLLPQTRSPARAARRRPSWGSPGAGPADCVSRCWAWACSRRSPPQTRENAVQKPANNEKCLLFQLCSVCLTKLA